DEARRGLCYDEHHIWRGTVVVTLPETLPCVLKGEVGPMGKDRASPALWHHIQRYAISRCLCRSRSCSAENNRSGRCQDMRPKPKQFATQYASIFGDASVVSAYQYRPPYPAETFALLLRLLDADVETRTVLDAGCGPGVIARQLVPAVDRGDAVDIAARMLA